MLPHNIASFSARRCWHANPPLSCFETLRGARTQETALQARLHARTHALVYIFFNQAKINEVSLACSNINNFSNSIRVPGWVITGEVLAIVLAYGCLGGTLLAAIVFAYGCLGGTLLAKY